MSNAFLNTSINPLAGRSYDHHSRRHGDAESHNLSPQLIGLEGCRVVVVTMSGDTRTFIVGRSMLAEPNHIERDYHDSLTGKPADFFYRNIQILDRIN